MRGLYLISLLAVLYGNGLAAQTTDPVVLDTDTEACTTPGTYHGRVIAEWLRNDAGEDREMRLIEDFAYCDPGGRKWIAPAGLVVDGASIPKFVWGGVGSPFVGDYRWASVIHDRYCADQSRPWKDVHRVFYDAMRSSGMSAARAAMFYAAVYRGGPRWTTVAGATPGTEVTIVEQAPPLREGEWDNLSTWVESDDRSLAEIEARIDASLAMQ